MGKKSKRQTAEQHLPDGSIDLLDEDKPIAGQKFVCLSFVSPDNIIKQKDHYFFEEFVKYFDFTKSMAKFEEFVAFIAFKYNMDLEELMKNYKEFLEAEKDTLRKTDIADEYKGFLEKNEDELTLKFQRDVSFQTNTRGLKVRGVFNSMEEAELRCNTLRKGDPHHNIYVGQVGVWMPWEPDAYKTGRVEYLQKELNDLMKKKQENEEKAKEHFEERLKLARQAAYEENLRRSKESGNKLTQRLDEHGNLVGIESTIEKSLGEHGEEITVEDVRNSLFEGEDVRTKAGDAAASQLVINIDNDAPPVNEVIGSTEQVEKSS
jgi:hypothetical protein